jgi:hypothetical protein
MQRENNENELERLYNKTENMKETNKFMREQAKAAKR